MTGHAALLETLARAAPGPLKALASELLPALGAVEVIASRSGLVMAPMRDTAQGTNFHLGEVLVAEAHIRLPGTATEGYGLIIGMDLEQAMAMAVLDAAYQAGRGADAVARFAATEARAQADADTETLRRIEATRVEMETF
ncbi:phosphonate C-P lyase system protein PhnG [Paracoccus suum]|uniref:Phosphonate C-P lyase system protein PhnG n=1 Tax=Paracoccus suum TaxID=2259340 RepID=A0A344PJB1_9RHOB|nr:phosphonate C-P lyase system protein PhnG [Paracoccus suum]AXC49466.1 phosphonate C-P lyase system protein PhnG [Paracoccus suum]